MSSETSSCVAFAAAGPSSAPTSCPRTAAGPCFDAGFGAGLLQGSCSLSLRPPASSWGLWLLLGGGSPLLRVVSGLVPYTDPPPPQGCAFCLGTWAPGLGPGLGFSPAHGVFRLLSGHVLPAARDDGAACDGAACALPALPPQLSSPRIQPRGAAVTSPALFTLGRRSGCGGTDRAHESFPCSLPPTTTECPQGPRSPRGAARGSGHSGQPGFCTPLPSLRQDETPLFSPAAPKLLGPALAGRGVRGGKEKPSFVLSEENWGFCFPGNGAAKAKPGGCRCCTKPAVSPSHSPGRSNRFPRPSISWAGVGASGRTRSFNSSSRRGRHGQPVLSPIPPPHLLPKAPPGCRSLGEGVDVGLRNPHALKAPFWDSFVPMTSRRMKARSPAQR